VHLCYDSGSPIYQEEKLANTATILIRGLLLRCPNCGKGKLFRRGFTMYEKCPVCGWRFEREEGYWTGAIALNLGLPKPFILPFLFFRHAKSFWMSIDFMLHPVDPEELR
jgi:uncharacterized protein (DUF983 family)